MRVTPVSSSAGSGAASSSTVSPVSVICVPKRMRAAVLDPPLPSLCSTSATVLAAVPGEALSPSRSSTSTTMR